MGFPAARWYCLECAESITAWGREFIKNLIEDAKNEGFEVLYGDTDSVFFKVKKKQDYEIFLKNQNKKMPKPVELEYGDFYKSGIFVSKKTEKRGAKKKYALLNEKGEIEIKGFEYVRRDWSEVARQPESSCSPTVRPTPPLIDSPSSDQTQSGEPAHVYRRRNRGIWL